MSENRPGEQLLTAAEAFIVETIVSRLRAKVAAAPSAPEPIEPSPPRARGERPVPPRPDELSGLYEKLVRHAPEHKDGPLTRKVLIGKTKHPVNAWSRDCILHLVAWGYLFAWPGNRGVSLPPDQPGNS